jgi:hypothetical protein
MEWRTSLMSASDPRRPIGALLDERLKIFGVDAGSADVRQTDATNPAVTNEPIDARPAAAEPLSGLLKGEDLGDARLSMALPQGGR